MVLAISNVLQCPSLQFSRKNGFLRSSVSNFPSSFVRFGRTSQLNIRVVCAASSAAGSSRSSDGSFDPYEVLGVSPIAGFEVVKKAYASKRKDAEETGDEATAAQLEKAYDKVMMAQLENRKKGVSSGSFQVPKDIKYADKQPLVPWAPRFAKSSIKDMRINLAISAVFTAWIFIQRNAEYKPLEFLSFAFVYRVFVKLREYEPHVKPTYTEDGEEEGRVVRMGKRLLRSVCLVFGCIAISSFGFTSILNGIELLGSYIPAFLYNSQEIFVTASSALMLYIVASYYR